MRDWSEGEGRETLRGQTAGQAGKQTMREFLDFNVNRIIMVTPAFKILFRHSSKHKSANHKRLKSWLVVLITKIRSTAQRERGWLGHPVFYTGSSYDKSGEKKRD